MIRIDGWFCCACHCYNPDIEIDIDCPPEYIPKKVNQKCVECDNITRVGTKGKKVV